MLQKEVVRLSLLAIASHLVQLGFLSCERLGLLCNDMAVCLLHGSYGAVVVFGRFLQPPPHNVCLTRLGDGSRLVLIHAASQ